MIKRISYIVAALVLMTACTNQETNNNTDTENTDKSEVAEGSENSNLDEELRMKLDIIISNNMLIPISIISDLKSDGKSLYHPEDLNSLDNIPKYESEFSKALNFGIYGVDIIYNLAHDHSDEIDAYRERSIGMAKSLGLDSFYIEEDMIAFKEAAKDDQLLSQFVYTEYHKIDDYLVSHDRFETMTLMLSGGIIESMYFTGRAIEEYGISDLKYSLLLNERSSLNQLIDLLNSFKGSDQDQKLKAEFEKLKTAFDSFSSKEDLTPAKIKELDLMVIDLRNKVVNNEL